MSTSIPWGTVKSAMLLGDNLFTAEADGRLRVRSFDASNGSSGPPASPTCTTGTSRSRAA
jgi:hypothetical protein